jgi:hypothetical protein
MRPPAPRHRSAVVRFSGVFGPPIVRLIQCKAAQLVGHHGFLAADRADLQQELCMHLISRQPNYEPFRASAHTFADRVLANKVTDLVRSATAACRDQRRNRQLPTRFDAPPSNGLSPARAAVILDVREAVARLPQELRAVATLLMAMSEAEAARRPGYTRQRMRTLRQHLAEALSPLDPAGDGARNQFSDRQPFH